nr:hypothetical protein Iba_chr14aCG1090 [Ipomoea batatas]
MDELVEMQPFKRSTMAFLLTSPEWRVSGSPSLTHSSYFSSAETMSVKSGLFEGLAAQQRFISNSKGSLDRSHALEREQRSGELPQHNAKTVDINFPSIRLLFDHLRSHPPISPHVPFGLVALRLEARGPEIRHLNAHLVAKQQVARLEIPVNHALRMKVLHPPRYVQHQPQNRLGRHETTSLYLDNVGMVEAGEEGDFGLELLFEPGSSLLPVGGNPHHFHSHSSLLINPSVNPAVGTRGKLVPYEQLRQISSPFLLILLRRLPRFDII